MIKASRSSISAKSDDFRASILPHARHVKSVVSPKNQRCSKMQRWAEGDFILQQSRTGVTTRSKLFHFDQSFQVSARNKLSCALSLRRLRTAFSKLSCWRGARFSLARCRGERNVLAKTNVRTSEQQGSTAESAKKMKRCYICN